jgi:hypothetical protein
VATTDGADTGTDSSDPAWPGSVTAGSIMSGSGAAGSVEVSTVHAAAVENPPTAPRTAPPRKSRATKTTWEPLPPAPDHRDKPDADPLDGEAGADATPDGEAGESIGGGKIVGAEFASTKIVGTEFDADTDTSSDGTPPTVAAGDDGDSPDGTEDAAAVAGDLDADDFDAPASDPGEVAKAGATAAVVAGAATDDDDDDDDEDHDAPAPGYKVTVRFGPGVPADGSKDVPARRRLRARRPRWSRIILNVAIAVVILAGATGYAVWHFNRPVNVDAVTVGLNQNLGTSCDVNVDVVGTIVTSGAPGVVTYQWKRDDGETSPMQKHSTTGDQPIVVHLHWMFSGPGKATGTVTLLVLKPVKKSAKTSIAYNCASLPAKK